MLKPFVVAVAAVTAVAHGALAQGMPSPLTKPIEYYNPEWSPVGRTLVFESTLDGKYSVYRVDADGTGLTRLTVNDANNEQPRWSPDGRRIVFSSDRDGHLDLYAMNADGSGQTRLTTTSGGGYYQSSFSPDGQWILFQGRQDNQETRDRLFLIRSDGTGWRQLTDSSYGAEGPRWSPDGKTITFSQVPYPKRLWSDMRPEDVDAAKKGQRLVTIRADGSGLSPVAGGRPGDSPPVWTRTGRTAFFLSERDGARAVYAMDADGSGVRRVADGAVVPDANPSPDGRQLAYTKQVDGWSGVYVYDIAARSERLVTGGRAVGPLGYLRTATLTAGSDTLDTYTSPIGGRLERGDGTYLVSSAAQTSGRRWELRDTWFDSLGRVTTRQYTRTAPRSLATELETVRAPTDSASMLISADRVTAWVVPEGHVATLFDAPTNGERYSGPTIAAAIVAARPVVGHVFVAPVYNLYGGNPVATRVDTLRVARRDTLRQGTTAIAVLVIERPNGGKTWVEEATGHVVAARGSAGPNRWWWHVRRGVQPPDTTR